VVIVFVAVMLALVGTLDWAFARAVLWVFSGN
jgi:preprotein translocase subunit SecE